MFDLPLLNLVKVIAIYGGLCGLLYIGTDGFHREAPFLNSVPTFSLTLLTLTLRVKGTIKLFTFLTFLILAVGVYLYSLQWRNNLQTVCALFTTAHILYILSFTLSMQRLWRGCAVVITIYVIAFLYFCFVDLFWSIPILVLNFSLLLITLAISLISSGSIWHYGSKRGNVEQQAALLRFLGLLLFMVCASLFLLNRFGNRIDRSNYLSRDMLKDWIFHTLQKFPTRSFAINRSQSQTKKSPNQSQMHDTMNEGNIITIETKAENSFLNAPKLAIRNKRKQKGGNGLMMIAILHLLLACGLIDLGMFLSIRFNHYGDIWPDSYVKLTVSEFRLYRNQMLSIRLLYSPVTIAIGLMIFFPKSIYLLIIFFSKVSFCRTMIVDGIISFVTLIYACITGVHAYIILHNISRINIGDRSDILCYAIRGPREKASQALRDHCLLVAYKMFGNHLSLQSIIAIFVIIIRYRGRNEWQYERSISR
ncbi:hypothetical protein ACO02O_01404 [Dirofilaria immitis]